MQAFIVTKRDAIWCLYGKHIARLLPVVEEEEPSAEKQAALERLRQRSRKGYHLGGQGVNTGARFVSCP